MCAVMIPCGKASLISSRKGCVEGREISAVCEYSVNYTFLLHILNTCLVNRYRYKAVLHVSLFPYPWIHNTPLIVEKKKLRLTS